MVLSRKKRQKLRAELNQSDPTPEIAQIKNPENVTGKKRSRDLIKGSEVSAIFKALLAKNGGKQGFQVGDVDGGSVLNGDDDDEDDDTTIEKKGSKILKVDEKSAALKKKKKKKKKKVKKKKVKVEEVVEEVKPQPQPQPQPQPVVENVVISEQIVQENSKGNDGDVRKVYVGGIPYYSTEDDIKSYFGECGAITEMDCMFFPETGKFRGIAIITFETEEAAENALVLDGSDMDGLYLKIQPYKTTRPSKTSNFSPPVVEGYNRIYAGNLSWDICEDDLRKFFSDCNISAIRFGTDKETGDFKGYAHVDFADAESLNKALKLDQQLVCGRPVKISRAVPKKVVTNSTMVKPESNREVNPVKPENNGGNYRAVESESINKVNDVVPPPLPLPSENKSGISSGKLKRRTCYECGERGHVSSDCPKKQNPGVTNSAMVKPESNSGNYPAVEPESVSEVNEVVLLPFENKSVVSSGKLKRRTCYECGERGHVSSDCPKKQNPGVTNSAMVKPESNWEVNPVKPENNSGNYLAVEAENFNEVVPPPLPPPSENKSVVSSGKLKRRTCYECGERGHLSSDCPKKQNP